MAAFNQLFNAEYEEYIDARVYERSLEEIKNNKTLASNYSFQNLGS
jgi:hypothetical protein